MKQLKCYGVKMLDPIQKVEIQGGNPIRVVFGLVATIISLGKAADQATEWFLDGWNNPN
jgi:hypothetical protein